MLPRFKTLKRESRWRQALQKVVAVFFPIWMTTLSLGYNSVYKTGTIDLAGNIVKSKGEDEFLKAIGYWCRSKRKEAQYVQISGAVVAAISSSFLSTNAASPDQSHWSCPAFWYSSVLLAVIAIFTAAQQSLALPDPDSDSFKELFGANPSVFQSSNKIAETVTIEKIKESFSSDQPNEVSQFALYAWQIPIMLLTYSVFAFLIGLCSGVISPLAKNPVWGPEAKVSNTNRTQQEIDQLEADKVKIVIVFSISSFTALCSWIFPVFWIYCFDDLKAGIGIS